MQCALKTGKATKKKVARDYYDSFLEFFKRDSQGSCSSRHSRSPLLTCIAEFVGWHGTNSDTAAFWAEKGQLAKPTAKTGIFDFILGPKSKTPPGSSGADAEIGPGVYVTDDQDMCVFCLAKIARDGADAWSAARSRLPTTTRP
jgi:hypothetical protein